MPPDGLDGPGPTPPAPGADVDADRMDIDSLATPTSPGPPGPGSAVSDPFGDAFGSLADKLAKPSGGFSPETGFRIEDSDRSRFLISIETKDPDSLPRATAEWEGPRNDPTYWPLPKEETMNYLASLVMEDTGVVLKNPDGTVAAKNFTACLDYVTHKYEEKLKMLTNNTWGGQASERDKQKALVVLWCEAERGQLEGMNPDRKDGIPWSAVDKFRLDKIKAELGRDNPSLSADEREAEAERQLIQERRDLYRKQLAGWDNPYNNDPYVQDAIEDYGRMMAGGDPPDVSMLPVVKFNPDSAVDQSRFSQIRGELAGHMKSHYTAEYKKELVAAGKTPGEIEVLAKEEDFDKEVERRINGAIGQEIALEKERAIRLGIIPRHQCHFRMEQLTAEYVRGPLVDGVDEFHAAIEHARDTDDNVPLMEAATRYLKNRSRAEIQEFTAEYQRRWCQLGVDNPDYTIMPAHERSLYNDIYDVLEPPDMDQHQFMGRSLNWLLISDMLEANPRHTAALLNEAKRRFFFSFVPEHIEKGFVRKLLENRHPSQLAAIKEEYDRVWGNDDGWLDAVFHNKSFDERMAESGDAPKLFVEPEPLLQDLYPRKRTIVNPLGETEEVETKHFELSPLELKDPIQGFDRVMSVLEGSETAGEKTKKLMELFYTSTDASLGQLRDEKKREALTMCGRDGKYFAQILEEKLGKEQAALVLFHVYGLGTKEPVQFTATNNTPEDRIEQARKFYAHIEKIMTGADTDWALKELDEKWLAIKERPEEEHINRIGLYENLYNARFVTSTKPEDKCDLIDRYDQLKQMKDPANWTSYLERPEVVESLKANCHTLRDAETALKNMYYDKGERAIAYAKLLGDKLKENEELKGKFKARATEIYDEKATADPDLIKDKAGKDALLRKARDQAIQELLMDAAGADSEFYKLLNGPDKDPAIVAGEAKAIRDFDKMTPGFLRSAFDMMYPDKKGFFF